MKQRPFETFQGQQVTLYELENDALRVGITDFGAIIQYIFVKCNGGERLVTFNVPTIEQYCTHNVYCGATIGRVAGRIAQGRYAIDGKEYRLDCNNGGNSLHGGYVGFDKRMYRAQVDGERLTLSLISPDGECGYNGTMRFSVTFSLCKNQLVQEYAATNDQNSIWSPTNHTYFTLGAPSAKDVFLRIPAQKYCPVNGDMLPLPTAQNVQGTPFDFTEWKTIGRDIDVNHEQLRIVGGGYDHNFVTQGTVKAEACYGGIALKVLSDLPGVQLYTANYVDGIAGLDKTYGKHSCFALEAQYFPNAINGGAGEPPLIFANVLATHYVTFEFSVG